MAGLRWSAQALAPVAARPEVATRTPHEYYVTLIPMVRARFALWHGARVGDHVPANVRSLLWRGVGHRKIQPVSG